MKRGGGTKGAELGRGVPGAPLITSLSRTANIAVNRKNNEEEQKERQTCIVTRTTMHMEIAL